MTDVVSVVVRVVVGVVVGGDVNGVPGVVDVGAVGAVVAVERGGGLPVNVNVDCAEVVGVLDVAVDGVIDVISVVA